MNVFKNLSAFFLAFSIASSSIGATAKVSDTVDFSAKLAELKNLITRCEEKNIPTDYEKITYNVIERFESYINEDILNSKPNEMIEFNISKIDEMYNEARNNLDAYLSGDKSAFDVQKPDISNVYNEGSVLYSGNQPVISVGYGAFDTAINNLPDYDKFGASNIQMEIGPAYVMKNKSWSFSVIGDADAKYEFVSDSVEGEKAVKFTFDGERRDDVYITMHQTVNVKPGVKYILTGKRKADDAMSNTWISLNNYNNRNYHNSSSDWKDFKIIYTVPEDVKKLTLRVAVESATEGYYLDDLCLVEENTAENLLINPGFEEEDAPQYEFDETSPSLDKLLKDLKTAEENNIATSVLLSPHYFPQNLSEEIYFDSGSFFNFNICHNDVKILLEDYLRGILPYLAEYKECIQNICISNEPAFATYCFYDFFLPQFHSFLKEKHGTIEKLNKAYKTTYTDFSEVDMPNGISGEKSIWNAMKVRSEAHYDWMLFNEKVLTDWHFWFAEIVKEYLPDIPLHSKLLETTLDSSEESYHYGRMIQGADLEMFDTFSDYAGNDALTYVDDTDSYYTTMFYYDYLRSATDKPIYNSEDHVIRDKTSEYDDIYAAHVGNYLWQGAVHGRSLSTLWLWDRNSGDNSSFEGSILYRPDVVNEVGKTSLDLTRLSSQIIQLWEENSEVAVYYSKPSRFYDEKYGENVFNVYKALLQSGKKVGIISDLSIDNLNKYKVLIVPEAIYTYSDTKSKIEYFIKNGGKVIYSGNSLSKDEYKNSLNNSILLSGGYKYKSNTVNGINAELAKYFYDFDMCEVELIDEDTGNTPVNIDWQYCVGKNGEILINVANLEYENNKNISVYYNGEKLSYLTDLISGEIATDRVELNGFKPRLLRYSPIKTGIEHLHAEDNKLIWDFVDPRVTNTTVYKVNPNGSLKIVGKTNKNTYTYSEGGSYIVKQDADKGCGSIITVNTSNLFDVQIRDINNLSDSITCKVNINNISDTFASGEFLIGLKDSDGNFINKGIHNLSLKPGEVNEISLRLPKDTKSSKVSVEADNNILTEINL